MPAQPTHPSRSNLSLNTRKNPLESLIPSQQQRQIPHMRFQRQPICTRYRIELLDNQPFHQKTFQTFYSTNEQSFSKSLPSKEKQELPNRSLPENFINTSDLKLETLFDTNPEKISKKQSNGLSKNQNRNPPPTKTFIGKSLLKFMTPDSLSRKEFKSLSSTLKTAMTTLLKT
ncbi:MAG: hypothetical protein LKM38_29760 [Pseudomonas veronii]|nr:hypothetical protein [Pseudomonas veronii]